MFETYAFLYLTLLMAFLVSYFRGARDHIFAPWPGYPLLFSTYFLFGTMTLTTPVSDGQWLLYTLALIGFWAGSLLVRASSKPLLKITKDELDVQKSYFRQSLNVPLVALVSFGGLALTLYLWQQSGIPLFSQNVDEARTSMVSNGYVAQLATSLDVAAIFALAYLFASWGSKRSQRFWICVLIVAVFVLVAVLSGSRSRFLKLALPGACLFHFLVRPIRLKALVILAFSGFIFIGLLGYYRWYSLWGELNRSEGLTLDAIFSYAFYELNTAASGLSIVLTHIPDFSPHTDGYLHLGPFTTPFGSGIPTPGDHFKQMIGGRWAGFGLAATFIAPMYADFSWAGVLGLCTLYAVILMLAYRAARIPRRTRIYKLCTYATIYFFVVSGIRSDWLSFEFIWFVAVGLGFYWLRRGSPQQSKAVTQPAQHPT